MKNNIIFNSINIIGRGLNFLLFWFIANKLGVSFASDWFFYVYGLVYFLISVTFYSIECSLVPTWPGLTKQEKASVFRDFLYIGMFLLIPLQIVGIYLSFSTPQLFGFKSPLTDNHTILLSTLLFIQPILAFYSSIFSSYLQASGHYFLPITHLTWRTVGVFAVLLLHPTSNSIINITIAYTIGEVLRTIILAIPIKLKLLLTGYQPSPNRRYKKIYYHIALMSMMTCSIAANPYIDIVMAGKIDPGSATIVEYATKMRGLPYLALNGFLVVLLGDWARNFGENISWQTIKKTTFVMAIIGIIFAVLFFLTKEIFIELFFKKEILSSSQKLNLNYLLQWYILGIPLMISSNILSRGLLIKKKFTILFLIGAISTVLNILFNILLINRYNVIGIAMSTTLVDALSLVFLYILTYRILHLSHRNIHILRRVM